MKMSITVDPKNTPHNIPQHPTAPPAMRANVGDDGGGQRWETMGEKGEDEGRVKNSVGESGGQNGKGGRTANRPYHIHARAAPLTTRPRRPPELPLLEPRTKLHFTNGGAQARAPEFMFTSRSCAQQSTCCEDFESTIQINHVCAYTDTHVYTYVYT